MEEIKKEKILELEEQLRFFIMENGRMESKNRKLFEEKHILFKRLQTSEELIERLEHLATFSESASEIAHEINNPVNFVSGSLSVIKRGLKDFIVLMNLYKQLDGLESQPRFQEIQKFEGEIDVELTKKELTEASDIIQSGMERIHEIAHNLSLLGKGEAAKPILLDVNQSITDTLMIIQEKIGDQIEIRTELGNIPEIMSYRGKLNQVFINIIKNAIEAIQENKKIQREYIQIQTRLGEESVVVSIKDTGKGMSEETKERLFDKFYTTKSPGKGTGLGMGVCKAIVEKHGGTIKVESERGKGTEFIITLPFSH